MKATRLQWLLPLFLSLSFSKISAQINLIPVPASYAHATDTVKQFFKGDMLSIAQDSVYLLNQRQLDYYRLLMSFKIDVTKDNLNMQQVFDKLYKSMAAMLVDMESLNKQMKANADATGNAGKELAETTLKHAKNADSLMIRADNTLKNAIDSLHKADSFLLAAKLSIKTEQDNRWKRSLKWGAIGGGVGAILGFILRSYLK